MVDLLSGKSLFGFPMALPVHPLPIAKVFPPLWRLHQMSLLDVCHLLPYLVESALSSSPLQRAGRRILGRSQFIGEIRMNIFLLDDALHTDLG
jgi:hypothetical protein